METSKFRGKKRLSTFLKYCFYLAEKLQWKRSYGSPEKSSQHFILLCFCNHFIVAHSLRQYSPFFRYSRPRGLQKACSVLYVHSGETGCVLNKAMQRILMAIIGHGRWQTVR